MNTMCDTTIGLDRTEEEIFTYEVSDEALESAAGTAKEKAGNYTLAACTDLSVGPAWPVYLTGPGFVILFLTVGLMKSPTRCRRLLWPVISSYLISHRVGIGRPYAASVKGEGPAYGVIHAVPAFILAMSGNLHQCVIG
jgi:hypothetical protein